MVRSPWPAGGGRRFTLLCCEGRNSKIEKGAVGKGLGPEEPKPLTYFRILLEPDLALLRQKINMRYRNISGPFIQNACFD